MHAESLVAVELGVDCFGIRKEGKYGMRALASAPVLIAPRSGSNQGIRLSTLNV